MWTHNYVYPSELYHHGIKGQKWGVRRSPRQLGHKSGGKTKEQLASEARKKNDLKNRGTFTVAELDEKVKRLRLEKELRELTEAELYSGRKAVKSILSNVGTKVVITAAGGAILYGAKAAISKEFSAKELASAVYTGGR